MMVETGTVRHFEGLLQEMIGLSSASVGASVIRHALARRMAARALPDLHAPTGPISRSIGTSARS